MERAVIDGYYGASNEVLKRFWENGGVINGVSYPLAKTFLHTHTDMGSAKDSILTVDEYLKTAIEMGARSVSVTDHAYMYGVLPLYKACETYNAEHKDADPIKCIIGVEFYVCEDVEDKTKKKHTRLHLIAYAKDEKGYKTLCSMVTKSNTRKIVAGKNEYPCISKKILEEYMGPGTEGHDHIILTSACIGGVVAGIMYESENEKKNVDGFNGKLKSLNYLRDSLDNQNKLISSLDEQIEKLSAVANKKYGKRQQALKKHPDEEALKVLEKEMKETELAAAEVKRIKAQKKNVQKGLTEITNQVKNLMPKNDSDVDYFTLQSLAADELCDTLIGYYERVIKEASESIVDDNNVEDAFKKEMLYYENLAGKGNWFIEMQFHGVANEKKYMHVLAKLANELDMPLVAANDAHMSTRDKVMARKIVNGLRFDTKGSRWE